MSTTAFFELLPVIDFVAQILGKDVYSRPMADADRVKTVQQNDYDQDPINIDSKLPSITARVLPAPWVQLKSLLITDNSLYDTALLNILFQDGPTKGKLISRWRNKFYADK
ncbi:hypothetical protein CCACVL1_23594 [Corchorus capsularis]|uniref:Uncharacterized protein n=1 Tax=Corchorus capsularis TaxID=210143 RepID=A0A1R3GTL4_COCAP|nr:hypothetical protein CCACVL1_23594 [Corchorus capsularis]